MRPRACPPPARRRCSSHAFSTTGSNAGTGRPAADPSFIGGRRTKGARQGFGVSFVRSFVRLLHLHVHARARTRARVRSREGAKRRPVLEPAKSGRSKELRAAPAATHGRYCASAETTPYIRGNTRYALRPSPRGGDETNQLALDSTSNRCASLVGVDHYQSDWYQRPQRGTTSRGEGASAQRPAPPSSHSGRTRSARGASVRSAASPLSPRGDDCSQETVCTPAPPLAPARPPPPLYTRTCLILLHAQSTPTLLRAPCPQPT